jgi:hypothetical protein
MNIKRKYTIEALTENESIWIWWANCDTRKEARETKKRFQSYYEMYYSSQIKIRIVQETWKLSEKKVIG